MTTPKRLYIVSHGDQKRLVKATSQSAAVNHVARGQIKAEIAKPLDIAELMQSGVKVEDTEPSPAASQP
jgi:hypothetical protein